MPAGRKRIQIDKTEFEKLCFIQCQLSEIAGWFRCSEDTIERWCEREYGKKFAECFKIYSQGGKISLRRSQFKLAEKNAGMAIFLGKQYLGQSDNPVTDDPDVVRKINLQIESIADLLNDPMPNVDISDLVDDGK